MLKIAFFEMEKEKTYTITTEIAHQKAKELLDRVLNEAKIEGVRVKPKLKAILKVNFYLHFKFGKKLLPFKNLIYDIKNNTHTSSDQSEFESLEQHPDQNKVLINWSATKEPYENLNFQKISSFDEFKKLFSKIIDENILKKIYEEQKKKDEIQYETLKKN